MKEFWDSRYTSEQYIYGELPNEYVKYAIDNKLLSGKVIFPAEGEGRNAVYAAQQDMDVVAFDQSSEAKIKAMRLAESKNVEIKYMVGNFMEIPLNKEEPFDGAALVYAHFPESVRTTYHQYIADHIKIGGVIVLESFSKEHIHMQNINPAVGGPQNINMLYTKEMILQDFYNFTPIEIEEIEVTLSEGIGHNGIAKVIRFIGIKR